MNKTQEPDYMISECGHPIWKNSMVGCGSVLEEDLFRLQRRVTVMERKRLKLLPLRRTLNDTILNFLSNKIQTDSTQQTKQQKNKQNHRQRSRNFHLKDIKYCALEQNCDGF